MGTPNPVTATATPSAIPPQQAKRASRERPARESSCKDVDSFSQFLAAGERESKDYALSEYQRIAGDARCAGRLKASKLLVLFGDGKQRAQGLAVLRRMVATKVESEDADAVMAGARNRLIAAAFLFLEGDRALRMDDRLRLEVGLTLQSSEHPATVKRGLRMLSALLLSPKTKEEVRYDGALELEAIKQDKGARKVGWKVLAQLAAHGRSEKMRFDASLVLAESSDGSISETGRQALLSLAKETRSAETRSAIQRSLEGLTHGQSQPSSPSPAPSTR